MAVGTVVNVAGYQGDFGRALEAYLTLLEWAWAQDDPFWMAGCHVDRHHPQPRSPICPDVARDELQRALEQAETKRRTRPRTPGRATPPGSSPSRTTSSSPSPRSSTARRLPRSVANGWLLGMNLSGLATALRHGGRAARRPAACSVSCWSCGIAGTSSSQLPPCPDGGGSGAGPRRPGWCPPGPGVGRPCVVGLPAAAVGPPAGSTHCARRWVRSQPWSGPFDDAIDEVVALDQAEPPQVAASGAVSTTIVSLV